MIAATSKEAANVQKTVTKNGVLPFYSNHKNPSIQTLSNAIFISVLLFLIF